MEQEILAGLITLSTGALISFIFEILQMSLYRFKWLKSPSVEWKRIIVLVLSTGAVLLNTTIGLKMVIGGTTFSAAILNSFILAAIAFGVYHLVIEKRIVVRLIDFSSLREDPEPEEEELPIIIGPYNEFHLPPLKIFENEDS